MTETEANANIAKLMAETERLHAETVRIQSETRKLNIEVPKLQNEAINFGVMRGKMYLEIILYPLVVFGAWSLAVVGALKFFGLLK